MMHMEKREVIPPLAIFRDMINCRTIDMHFAGTKVALEIGHVVQRVPQTELDVRKQLQPPWRLSAVFNRDLQHFAIRAERHEGQKRRRYFSPLALNPRVSQSVSAFEMIDRPLHRHVADRPEVAVELITQIKIPAAAVDRNVVVS